MAVLMSTFKSIYKVWAKRWTPEQPCTQAQRKSWQRVSTVWRLPTNRKLVKLLIGRSNERPREIGAKFQDSFLRKHSVWELVTLTDSLMIDSKPHMKTMRKVDEVIHWVAEEERKKRKGLRETDGPKPLVNWTPRRGWEPEKHVETENLRAGALENRQSYSGTAPFWCNHIKQRSDAARWRCAGIGVAIRVAANESGEVRFALFALLSAANHRMAERALGRLRRYFPVSKLQCARSDQPICKARNSALNYWCKSWTIGLNR